MPPELKPVSVPTLQPVRVPGEKQGQAPAPSNQDAERDSYEELDEFLADCPDNAPPDANAEGFRKRAATDKERFDDAVDADFWCCVVFQSRAQKNEWLKASGLGLPDSRFADGMKLAKRMGVELVTPVPALRKRREHAGLKKLSK